MVCMSRDGKKFSQVRDDVKNGDPCFFHVVEHRLNSKVANIGTGGTVLRNIQFVHVYYCVLATNYTFVVLSPAAQSVPFR